jgi:hypothetical protein
MNETIASDVSKERAWVQSDEYQYVRKLSDNTFQVVETVREEGDLCAVYMCYVDLTDYSTENIEGYLKFFGYLDLKSVEAVYGDAAQKIIAECIAETITRGIGTLLFTGSLEAAELFLQNLCELGQ